MTTTEITLRVQKIVAGVARRDDAEGVPLDGDIYRDLGVKSTAALDLLLSLEEAFGVSIPDEAFGDARTVGGLAGLIRGLR
jgi:acyl carrier protein